jgi:hypothetical protein
VPEVRRERREPDLDIDARAIPADERGDREGVAIMPVPA